jgi:beta-glucosidase
MVASAFPKSFTWGAATSSYQIEGASDRDGRGESIWDHFARQPGKILDHSDGSIACGHYDKWREDIQLLSWLGVKAYRFSVAWPRVFPTGVGAVNQPGLDFYDRLVDGLLAASIEPTLTLYHWDLPQTLQDMGGWPARATVHAFVHYADVVSRRLGDRVTRWITHNEPWCASILGYAKGEHAPGYLDRSAALAAAHHLLLSHGGAVPAIRANVARAEVGITLNLTPGTPATSAAEDLDACREFDGAFNRWFLDPLYGRGYPEDVVRDYLKRRDLSCWPHPFVRNGDLERIATSTDFLGINYYSRAVVSASNGGPRQIVGSGEETDMGWEVYPTGLTDLLVRVHREYAPGPIYITENGAAYSTGPDEAGAIHDTARQRYLYSHIAATLRAIELGVPVSGYFVWSLLDNFEWAHGYTKRFGIVWTNYETLERTPKKSAHWCREVFAQNRLVVATEGQSNLG